MNWARMELDQHISCFLYYLFTISQLIWKYTFYGHCNPGVEYFSTKSVITQFIKEWLHRNKNKTKHQPPMQSSFFKVILRKLVIKLLLFCRRISVARHKLPNHGWFFFLRLLDSEGFSQSRELNKSLHQTWKDHFCLT